MKDLQLDIGSKNQRELQEMVVSMGDKPFRGRQIYEWLHKKHVNSYDDMTNLSKTLREQLKEKYIIPSMDIVNIQRSKLDGTEKFLFLLEDGNVIESVLMRYKHGNSVCISSQVGCRMGCAFCASTIDGLARNLRPYEMLGQIYEIGKFCKERISNVVIMGSGEPLDNYDNVLRFLKMVSDNEGICISQRNITLSTCGLVPKIYELAEEQLQITLALSLHGVTDEKRQRLMPIAKKYKLDEIMNACRKYFDKTGRRITFEYSLVKDINDKTDDAIQMAYLLKGLNCHVNLIPINPVKERDFQKSTWKSVENFKIKLEKYGINVTIRREMGSDIDGACGQLRKRFMDGTEREKIQ